VTGGVRHTQPLAVSFSWHANLLARP